MATLTVSVSDSISVSETVATPAIIHLLSSDDPTSAQLGITVTSHADYLTLTAGDTNGLWIPHRTGLVFNLWNDGTGGNAVFKFITAELSTYDEFSISIDDHTVTVANNSTGQLILNDNAIFRQSDGYIRVACDVAGKVLVTSLS